MVGSDPEPDIAELFCHYNALYFQDSLGACAVSWAEEPLPYGDTSGCDYYPGGGGCIVLLSKSLYELHTYSDLKNVLLHEMIHAYVCIKDNNTNHSNHGANFQKLMNTINSSSVPDRHRPLGGYNIIMLHDIRKKCYKYECDGCGDFVRSTKIRGPSHDDCIERMGANSSCPNSACQWHRHKKRCSGSYYRIGKSAPGCAELGGSLQLKKHLMNARLPNQPVEVGMPNIHQISQGQAISMNWKMHQLSSVILLMMQSTNQDWAPLQGKGVIRKSNYPRTFALAT